MPLKGEAKRQATKAWRKRAAKTGYHRWLYDRRRLVRQDADDFRGVLLVIKEGGYGEASELARKALNRSKARERKVGPSPAPGAAPKTNENGNGHHDGVSLAEALRELGLGPDA